MSKIDFGIWTMVESDDRRFVYVVSPRDESYGEYYFAGVEVVISKRRDECVIFFDGRPVGIRSTLKGAKNLATDKMGELRQAASRKAAAKRAMEQIGREISSPEFSAAMAASMDEEV